MDLREYLFRHNITQRKFADMLEVTPQYIHNIVKGKTKPGRRLAKAIVEMTQELVTLSELMKKSVDKKPSKA